MKEGPPQPILDQRPNPPTTEYIPSKDPRNFQNNPLGVSLSLEAELSVEVLMQSEIRRGLPTCSASAFKSRVR